jgi:hypothetical protein
MNGVETPASEYNSKRETIQMPDPTPKPAPVLPATPSSPANPAPPAAQRGPTINIGDEFGTAERNLPPVKVLLLATVGILIIVGIYSFFQRARPQGDGSLDNVAVVEPCWSR